MYSRPPLTNDQLATIAEDTKRERQAAQEAISESGKQRETAPATVAAFTPHSLASLMEVPIASGRFILHLLARIEQLEKKVAALEAPPHMQAVEKRAE